MKNTKRDKKHQERQKTPIETKNKNGDKKHKERQETPRVFVFGFIFGFVLGGCLYAQRVVLLK